MDMQYTQKEATKRPMLLGYTVIGMGQDAKFTRACLNSGRIGGEKISGGVDLKQKSCLTNLGIFSHSTAMSGSGSQWTQADPENTGLSSGWDSGLLQGF